MPNITKYIIAEYFNNMNYRLDFLFDYVFPTYILPNATMPEFGMINYLSSMHNDTVTGATVFEQMMPPSQLFNKDFSTFPNSATGYFYQAQVYGELLHYRQLPFYLNRQPTNTFIYPIKPNPDLTAFIGVDTGIGNRLNGEFFWKYISKVASDEIKQKKGIIFIDYSMEPYMHKYMHERMHTNLKNSGIPADSIYWCVNSFNARECYESWFSEDERMYNVRNLPFCYDHSSWYYDDQLKQNTGVCMAETDFLNSKDTIRPNHFLMKIRNGRSHRLVLLFKMVTDDLLELGDWSFLAVEGYHIPTIDSIISEFEVKDLHIGKIKKLYDTAPHVLQSEPDITHDKINAWTDENFQAHINSYFEICFETFIGGEHKSLTEKVFKPIINFQPFIFVAYPGALKLLRDLGFKTFEGFIDESYDEIEDRSKWLDAIFVEVKRLCAMSKEELHSWYWQMEDILIHNHRRLLEHHTDRLCGEDLIQELSDICNKRR